eukprot:scaffold200592_cov51-Prasinocladus_malaysianus.AAC.1
MLQLNLLEQHNLHTYNHPFKSTCVSLLCRHRLCRQCNGNWLLCRQCNGNCCQQLWDISGLAQGFSAKVFSHQ